MGRRIVVMKLICSLGHCEWNGHTVHKLSQRHLTADLLAPRESDCSRMHSKVSSDLLPSYIKATRPVLGIFKMAEYFRDSHRILLHGVKKFPAFSKFFVLFGVSRGIGNIHTRTWLGVLWESD